MKLSIRFSIASIFAILLLLAMSIVIAVNYFTMHRLLLNSSKFIIQDSSKMIELKLSNFLKPLEDRARISTQLFQQHVVNLKSDSDLRKYLLNMIKDRPSIYSAYIGFTNGNFFIVEKDYTTGKLHLKVVKRNKKAIQEDSLIDDRGNILSQKETTTVTYDPRVRPWYRIAVKHQVPTWTTIYQYALTPDNQEIYGVTVGAPIYNAQHQLIGVFGIDTTIDVLGDFLTTIKATPNAFLFIMDGQGQLILPKDLKEKICGHTICHMSSLTIPWVKHSLEQYQRTKQNIVSTRYQSEHYLAAFQHVKGLFGDSCLIGAVLPLSDIAGPMQFSVLICIIITFIILLLSLVIVRIFAGRISHPIIKLSEEARAIADLDFSVKKPLRSWIKEVVKIRDAFDLMRRGLNSFLRYVPGELVKKLMSSNQIAEVGGVSKEITLFFSDIMHFTSLSETMAPTEVMGFLSEYFEAMSQVICNTKGTIDKYIGDGLMAFWGAPLEDSQHAAHACQCALYSLQVLKRLNAKWEQEGKPVLHIRIGINTANVVVGNVGGHDRLSYTALGDGVNLASRLEALNKLYGTSILVTESTYQQAKDQFAFRLIDHVAVRGKSKSGRVYELMDNDHPLISSLVAYKEQFFKAFDLYQAGEWLQAIHMFEALKQVFPDDQLVVLYLNRCKILKEKKPALWQGVWIINGES